MKKWLIVSLVVIAAIALGVGGAYAFNKAYPVSSSQTNQQGFFRMGPMMNGGYWDQNENKIGPGLYNQMPGWKNQRRGQNFQKPTQVPPSNP